MVPETRLPPGGTAESVQVELPLAVLKEETATQLDPSQYVEKPGPLEIWISTVFTPLRSSAAVPEMVGKSDLVDELTGNVTLATGIVMS